jgi:predicted nucleic acid-binding protein
VSHAASIPAMAALTILWTAADGGEHEESWPSVDAFLAWAAGEALSGEWRAYQADEDGELVLLARGTLSAAQRRKPG